MNFGASDPLQNYQITSFAGVDFSTLENKVHMSRSPDASNMIINHNGHLEKRTGYRRLYQGEDRINGIFDFQPSTADEMLYIAHIGTKLYRIWMQDGNITKTLFLMDGLKNEKSRHFVFGDKLYILGAGYVQLAYREERIEVGFVKNIGTSEEVTDVWHGRTPGKTDGENMAEVISTDACLHAAYYTCTENIFTKSYAKGTKIDKASNLILPTKSETVKIERVCVLRGEDWTEWDLRYVSIGNNGKTVHLLGNPRFGSDVAPNTTFTDAFSFNKIKVVYREDPSVYAPLMYINRSAVPVRRWRDDGKTIDNSLFVWSYGNYALKGYAADEFLGKLPLDGDGIDSANFANGRRKVQFKIPEKSESAITAHVLYLTDEKSSAKIHRIIVDGVTVHDYSDTDMHTKLISNTTAACYVSRHDAFRMDPKGRFIEILYLAWHSDYDRKEYNKAINSHIVPGSVIEVDYTVLRSESDEDEQINECAIYGIYGGNNDTRVFLAGNPKHRNRDYASGLYDGSYFPNDMYTDVGSEASAIVGYHKLYSNQIIVKDDATEDASQYLRSLSMDEAGNVVYTLLQGHSTYGACAASSFKNVSGIPFYIGKGGVYTIAGTTVQNQNNTTLRSEQINKRFIEEDLSDAVCCGIGNKYIVATKSHMWICDTLFDLEWFCFEELPEITCLWPRGERLYFGTSDGRICVFSKDDEKNAYYDNLGPDGSTVGAEPVKCRWCTPVSAFDNWNMLKTIVNVYFSCMPYNDSSVHVYYNTSDEMDEEITTEHIALFDFADLHFDNFSFDTVRQPKPFATGVKAKNVYVFGVKLENVKPQPFGIVSVGYKFKYSKYVK